MSSVRLTRRFLVSSESTLRRSLISSLAEELVEDDGGLSLGGGGKLESSSTTGGAIGLDTADPPPSTPLLTDGVFSESLHSSSSPEIKNKRHLSIEFFDKMMEICAKMTIKYFEIFHSFKWDCFDIIFERERERE